jgi:hypothetical protein
MRVTVRYNPWKLPAPPVYLEGAPSPEEQQRQVREAEAARAVWKPDASAFALLDELRPAIGQVVVVQGWDPIMLMLDDEGPHPLRARCVGMVTRDDEEGRTRAYLLLEGVEVIQTAAGYDPRGGMSEEEGRLLFPLDQLYELVTA